MIRSVVAGLPFVGSILPSPSSFSIESTIDAAITGEAAGIAGAGLTKLPFTLAFVDLGATVFEFNDP
jgi:hypothetical protein